MQSADRVVDWETLRGYKAELERVYCDRVRKVDVYDTTPEFNLTSYLFDIFKKEIANPPQQ